MLKAYKIMRIIMDIKGTPSFKPPITQTTMTPVRSAITQQTAPQTSLSQKQSLTAFTQDRASTGIQGRMQSLAEMTKNLSEAKLYSDPAGSTNVMKNLSDMAMPLLGDSSLVFSSLKDDKKGSKDSTEKKEPASGEKKSSHSSGTTEGGKGISGKKPFSRLAQARQLINKEFAGSALGKGGLDSLKKPDMAKFAELRQEVVSKQGGAPSQEQLKQAISNAAIAIWDILKKARKEDDKNETTSGLLGVLMKIHSAYTFEHSNRVSDLTMGLASELGIDDEQQLQNLKNAALFKDIGQYGPDSFSYLSKDSRGDIMDYIKEIKKSLKECSNLHDIGKMRIPDTILNKNGKLNDEEFAQIKKHPMIGVEIVLPYPALHGAIPGIRHHHEKWDGSGYPDRKKGLDIPLQARIIAICDTFDAMTEDRPYRKALTSDYAVQELLKCAGTQFDPTLVPAFIYSLAKKGEIDITLYEKQISKLEETFNFQAKPKEEINFKIKEK